MRVCNLTTPANYFHALRRQLKANYRKPLVQMTPKSLLRHKLAVSSLADFGPGSAFRYVIPEIDAIAPEEEVRRVVLCTGKVYYDLIEEREKRGIDDVYVLRIEQLYPFPAKSLAQELAAFENAEIVWCQEDPRNMGAWFFVEHYVSWASEKKGMDRRLRYVGRPAAASTAVGQMSKHQAQLRAFLDDAFA